MTFKGKKTTEEILGKSSLQWGGGGSDVCACVCASKLGTWETSEIEVVKQKPLHWGRKLKSKAAFNTASI